MASGVLLDSSQEEKKRKWEDSSLLSIDMDVDPASKRPCLATGSDGQVGMARQNQNTGQWLGPASDFASDWEQVHRQTDEGESPAEQGKRADWSHLPKTLRRAESEPPPDTGPPKGRPWASSFGQSKPQLTNPQLTGMVEDGNPLRGNSKPVRKPGNTPLTLPPRASGMTVPHPSSPDSNTSSRLSKRSFEEEDRATASGAGVSGVSHECSPGRMTSATHHLRPAPKHRRILEEVSSSSEDDGEGDVEFKTGSAMEEQPAKGGPKPSRNEGGGARSSDSGRPVQSSVESAPLHDGGLFAGGRRQVFPPLPGMMKRSTSRADLTEERRPATPSGGGVPLFEWLTRGLPPAMERSGESVGSERSNGGRSTKDKEELRRKELDSLPPALRTSMFPLRAESGLSGLGTSDRGVPNSKTFGGVGVENMVKQGSAGAGFKPRPPMSGGGLNSPGVETLGAAKFVLPNGVKITKAASDSLVQGPTLTDEAMQERTLNSVSITSAQGRKQTVENEFEAYFAQMGISM